MKTSVLALIFVCLMVVGNAFAQSLSFFKTIEGNWEGTLEYQDYNENKRVKLKTYLIVKASFDGRSAEVTTVYDDFGTVIKDVETERIDGAAMQFVSGDFEYKIDALEDGKMVLLASGQDGDSVEPIRKTITYDNGSLTFLKETRTPWQFRNQLTLKRSAENILEKKVLSREQVREDLDVLKKALIALHPGLFRYIDREKLEKEFAEATASVVGPTPENDVFLLYSQLTEKIKCGHTYLNPYNQNSIVRDRIFNGKTYFPFYFRIVNGKFIVTENASSSSLAIGSEITRINDVSVKDIIKKLLSVAKGDGNSTLEHRINSLELTRFEAERYALFDMYFPLFFPLKAETFKIEAIDFATKKPTNFQVPALTRSDRKQEMAKRYGRAPNYDDGWKFDIQENSTAYLKIGNFITWRLKTIKFKEFLANAFTEMRAKSIKNLIIDVRENGGGDMDPGFELSRYLAKEKLAPYAESRRLIRNASANPEIAKYVSTYDDAILNGVKNGLPADQYRKLDANYFQVLGREDYPAVEPYENRFTGRAFVIADSSNASATFQFLEYVQKHRLATIVGQVTGGNKQGINGGNFLSLTLPNSKAEVDIPLYYQAPLNPQNDESIVPDIIVKRNAADIGSRVDRELAAIRAIISRKRT